ncbi:copper amine oxidase N-terminal domain-containing protein [Oscillospiraceae bacterium OttesenSCG-928-F05]|nr:copper amine oxidase N-terminal domain-containing protein [Oscillospiraceae bacterium OttesenSCG-928-F05]
MYKALDGYIENDCVVITFLVANATRDVSAMEQGKAIFDSNGKVINIVIGGEANTTPTPPAPTQTPPALVAKPIASTVLVNGSNVAFDAYNIGGNNYFKLRDLAYILSGTEKQFDVGWDGVNNAISLTSGVAYTAVGGEMEGKGSGDKTPTATTSKIYLNGKQVTFTAYNIEGNNYFKLRDVGQAFDFNVSWDGANNTIVIATDESYTAD